LHHSNSAVMQAHSNSMQSYTFSIFFQLHPSFNQNTSQQAIIFNSNTFSSFCLMRCW